jgi:NAD(P)H-nitrite reductase large subunit
MRHVVVGNSAAAVGAIEAIRQYDQESHITVVADEPHHVYSRPLISYLLGGTVNDSQMYYRPADFYDRHNVETMLGTKVACVTPQEQRVSLTGGGTVS